MNILSFHESTVTKFLYDKNNFVIGLEDVSTDCSSDKVEIVVKNLSKMLIDSAPAADSSFKMPCDDGEVLTLELDEKKVFILVEWNDFCSGTSFTQSYEINGDRVQAYIL